MFHRVFLIVLDSVGIGALPDAADYGDTAANTLGNIARVENGLVLPNLERLGLGCIAPITGVGSVALPLASYGKMAEISLGKDTTSGHWEMAGAPVFQSFPVYPQGFPQEIIEQFTSYTGKKILGNKPASGTEIIAELGEEHLSTGFPIIYTSADSVFQIAAHEAVVPLEELYDMCRIVRTRICVGAHAVGRVIARPFTGSAGNFIRTANRHDFSLEPQGATMLDRLKENSYSVIGVGKIADIYAGRGITRSFPTQSNQHGMETLLRLVYEQQEKGLTMVNLVEFDSAYGHRNDVKGYARALEAFDAFLKDFLPTLQPNDLMIITADHGCDPTVPGTDHTREYVPLLVFSPRRAAGVNLGIRRTFADVAATILHNFGLPNLPYGTSFLDSIRGE